jgi:CBS domain containing-hemolysin-like protein
MPAFTLSLDSDIHLMRLLTTAEACVCLQLGKIDQATLQVLKKHDFETAPVLGHDGRFVGLIGTDHAIALQTSGNELLPEACITPLPVLPERTSVNQMLTQLASTHVAVVVKEINSEIDREWLGLVTASDLNRHYFRILVYEWLAELEVGLVRMIERYAGDHETWIRSLNEEAQARILGYWHLSRMNGADIGPLAGCMLTDLTKIAGSDAKTLEVFQLSKTKFHEHVGGLPQLRNQVMHPVRPMVTKPEDVSKLHGRLKNAAALILRISGAGLQ